jgi:hypothetical protein
MARLREFYQRYRQYILTDGLMYIVFLLVLAVMFLFFRYAGPLRLAVEARIINSNFNS